MLHSDLPFSPEKIKINNCPRLVCNVTDKKKYSIHIVALKQALNHGLKLIRVHSVISFREEAWLNPYIDLNTELRKNVKNEFEKDFYKLKINAIYDKTVQNDGKHRDIKLVTKKDKRNKLASEPNYHSTKCILKHLLIMEMKKIEVKINKPIYLGQALLDLSKALMFEFWYDYLKPMNGDKIRLCYTDTDSFIMHVKKDEFYKDTSADVDKWFDTSNFNKNDNRPLEIGKNKKVLGKFKDEIGGKIITKFVALRAKTYLFLIDDFTDDDYEKNRIVNKKAKGIKNSVIKREILFNNYIDSLFKNKALHRSQQRFRSDHHKVYTEEVNKIALSRSDDKRIQTFDKVTTYPYCTNVFIVCRNEMLLKKFINSKSLSLRDKSQVLRKESQALRNNSLLFRNQLKEIRAASHNIKNKSYILRTESQMLRNKSAKSEIEKELKVIREKSLQKPRKSDNDNKPCDNKPYDNDKSKLQVVINVIDKNVGINKNKSIKPDYKSDLLNKMHDDNILPSKSLLEDRKIFNYMGMILKRFICEQFICGKLYTTKSNRNITILRSRKRLIKNIKITICKEEIFIRIENN